MGAIQNGLLVLVGVTSRTTAKTPSIWRIRSCNSAFFRMT